MTVEVIRGDVRQSEARFIVHQVNSVTSTAAGLAAQIFRLFPWADIYSPRARALRPYRPRPEELPGQIIVRGDGESERFVINLVGQFYPGKPKNPDSERDGYAARERAFAEALARVLEIPDLKSVAFPSGIGCGLAGGDWKRYRAMIEQFASRTQARVLIYEYPG